MQTVKEKTGLLLGNFLEFYDFTLFAALLPIITPMLFPDKEITNSLLFAYGFLAIGFFARPAGAVLFGFIGDTFGRKKAMIISIIMMSISTLSISFIPSDTKLSFYGLWILGLCRILQGLSAGGEYCGAGLLLIENTPKEQQQYFKSSLLTTSALVGAFSASLAAAFISSSDSTKENWRILFLIGGMIGFITLWLRSSYKEIPKNGDNNFREWKHLFKEHRSSLIYTIFFGALMNVPFQMVTGFINTYFATHDIGNKTVLMFTNSLVILFCAIITISFGFLSKKVDPMKMMLYASCGMSIFAFPFFFLISSGSFFNFIFAELALLILSQLFVAPAFTVMMRLFPYSIRYRGVALGNCIGLAFLGGITPFVSLNLIKLTELKWSPAIYLFTISLMGFYTTRIVANKFNNKTTHNKYIFEV
ncbi:MAG: MFS transporter [Rickettsiales bacterium]|nr:MAG: MFS transporter [Rickettsiales bacterium]